MDKVKLLGGAVFVVIGGVLLYRSLQSSSEAVEGAVVDEDNELDDVSDGESGEESEESGAGFPYSVDVTASGTAGFFFSEDEEDSDRFWFAGKSTFKHGAYVVLPESLVEAFRGQTLEHALTHLNSIQKRVLLTELLGLDTSIAYDLHVFGVVRVCGVTINVDERFSSEDTEVVSGTVRLDVAKQGTLL
jgi:hypothetical protein